jgi:hypothetical protein
LISIKNQNIGLSLALVANFNVMLLVVVQLFIKINSGLVDVRSRGFDQALMYLREPVSAILKFCVVLLKYAHILNTFQAGSFIMLFTGVSIV